ncbi:MAG: 2-oxo acid dehydrogenase subunit E2 [Clostridia bacterium]|nr:2-oxo acid dehydrogenase subunit E2 [Clostridia bacterium]
MFGKRYDGRLVKNVDPFAKIMPYIMKTRTDSMTMFEESIPCDGMDAYIAKREAEGKKLDYMQLWIAAAVRTIALRPQMNRFIMNGRIYARNKIWVSFAVHHSFRTEQEETTIKLCFDGTESLDEIADAIHDAVVKETTAHKGDENSTDTLAKVITRVPSPIIRLIVNTLMFMDRHNIMPKAVIEASPFHTSLFITNLKSLGINHVFHHIYEFGTTGLFLAMGKEKKVAVVDGGEIVPQKHISFGFVSDERVCDGLYFARSLKMMKKFLKNPARMEERLESKVEDVR